MKLLEKELKNNQVLIFMDLEGTQFSHEMIEIGAYKVYIRKDFTIKKVMPGFKAYVRPKAKVGKVVTDLTGITDEKVKKDGKPFRVVLSDFKKYVGKEWNHCLFVTFGTHDSRIISQSIANNLDASKDDGHHIMSRCWDFAGWLSHLIRDPNGNTYSLSNFLKLFGLPFEGKEHDAMADALNLVDLYKAVIMKKGVLKDACKKTLALKNNHFPEPVFRLLNDLRDGKDVSPELYDSYVQDYIS